MKKKIALFLFLFSNLFLFAQTEASLKKIVAASDTAALNNLSIQFDSIFKIQKAEALKLAKINGWPILKKLDNGGVSELMRVDNNGNPVYYSTDNVGAALTTRANRLNSGGSLGLSLDGQNMNIGIWDGGKVRKTHLLLAGRVTQVDNAIVLSDHATHVSGTMMGNATASPASKGMASQANLRAYDWNNDLSEVTIAASNGLLVSNHSYGSDPQNVSVSDWGKYDATARAYDQIMYNAPYYQFVNSAGNSRNAGYNPDKDGFDLLSGKSTSKNGIIVAAVNQVSNYTSASSVVMSGFSSWGPTDDGRIKPDICGKGVNLKSSISTSDTAYDSYSGTSMASPNVAGTLLLLQQHYNNVKGNYMRASTLRGLAIHTADEAGPDPGPDYRFGWGLLNAEKAANLITTEGIQSKIKEKTLNQGDSYSFNIQPYSTSQSLDATICWTDPAGVAISNNVIDYFSSALVNDLDIRITKNAIINYPWKLNPAIVDDPATKEDNTVDNVEKISVSNPSNTYTVTISHKGNLTNGLQNYSLILSNVSNSQLLLSTNKPLVNRICEGTATTLFDFQMETNAAFNQTATFSVSGLPAGTTAIFTAPSLSVAANNTITITNLNAVPAGTYPIVVSANAANASSNLFFTLIVQNTLAVGPTLITPANNATQIDTNPILNWSDMGTNVASYTIEVAKDPNFISSLQSLTSITNQVAVANLDYGTNYFWRVKATNVCGETSFSSTYNFSTPCSNDLVITITNPTITGATVTWTNPNAATNFEILVVPHGTSPTGTYSTVTTNSYTFDSLNSYSSYDVYLRSSCNTNSFSALVSKQFSTLINHCIDGVFFDSGNTSGNYSNGEYITTTMNPINSGDKVSVTFSAFSLEDQIDRLYIYNGPDATFPYIGPDPYGFTGTVSPGTVTSTDSSGKLTFVFYSDGVNTAPGWNASVTCASLATTTNTKNLFHYYPNPASSEVYFSGAETIKSISVFTLLGQLIRTEMVNSNQATIAISSFPAGTFLFKVETASSISTVKVIKN